jgi:eukaryotic-like serine/threonine-protein kinase
MLVSVSSVSESSPSSSSSETLASEMARAMVAAWHSGRRVGVEDMLRGNPALASTPRAVLRLISEELFLRRESGEPTQIEEILSRFPQWRAELELLLACHDLFEAGLSPPNFPSAGERCGEFTLLQEIGRGSQGRVFLAIQPSLSDRPVIIKLTAMEVSEHLSLARLQHTGIVPLYLAQDLPDRQLRLLCMPFMGGASVAAVLAAMKPVPLAERSGKTISDSVARCHIEAPGAAPLGGPALEFLCHANYVQAICWIGACLAEALHYAHQRGLVHFDLKPSNLLVAGDGQPMLLDFHLARGPIIPGRETAEWIGGTQQYMPPEQAAALDCVRSGRPVAVEVDARADIYALGMVLDELLGGEGPLARPVDGPYGLRHVNPDVTRGLADILAKCLSPDAEARYADAQSLADDLRRHLVDLPLRGVANRSPVELWRKWRRRRPHSAVRFVSASVTFAALAGAAWLWAGQRISHSQQALRDAQKLLDRQAYSDAIDRLQQAIDGLQPLPFETTLKRTLRAQLDGARRARLVYELHQFVERLRFLDAGAPITGDTLQAGDQSCRSFWTVRDRLLQADDNTTNSDALQVQADLLDLVVSWLHMQTRLTLGDAATGRARAVKLLDEAEASLGPSDVLRYERQYLTGEGPSVVVDDHDESLSPSNNARYMLGRFFLRTGNEPRALAEFRRAVHEKPQEFWANYYRGRCAYSLKSYAEALNAFCVCVALAPTQAECFYNRALVYTALRQDAEALLDYDRALELDPTLDAAATNRDALRRERNP